MNKFCFISNIVLLSFTLYANANSVCTNNCSVKCPESNQLVCTRPIILDGPFILKSTAAPGDWYGSGGGSVLGFGRACPHSFTFIKSNVVTNSPYAGIACYYSYTDKSGDRKFSAVVRSRQSDPYGCNGNGTICTGNNMDAPCTISNADSTSINFFYSYHCINNKTIKSYS